MINYLDFADLVCEFVNISFGNSQIPINSEEQMFHPCQVNGVWDCVCGVNDPKLYFVKSEFENLMKQIHLGIFGNTSNLFQNMYLTIPGDDDSNLMSKIGAYLYLLHEVCEINDYKSIDAGIQMANFLYLIWEKRQERFGLRKIRDIYYRHRNDECVHKKMFLYLVD